MSAQCRWIGTRLEISGDHQSANDKDGRMETDFRHTQPIDVIDCISEVVLDAGEWLAGSSN